MSLLSIQEAAGLLGVSQNTLRDWDIEGKLVAQRTNGGHRRYSIEQIRAKMIDRIDDEKRPYVWGEYLLDVESEKERSILDPLLDNTWRFLNVSTNDNVLSTKQAMVLTKLGFLSSRLRHHVDISVLERSRVLVHNEFVLERDENRNTFSLNPKYQEVKSKTWLYDFGIFPDCDFESVKNAYARSIGMGIDEAIMSELPKKNEESFDPSRKDQKILASGQFIEKYKDIVPSSTELIEVEMQWDQYIDLTKPQLDLTKKNNTVNPMPTFCPYQIFKEAPRTMMSPTVKAMFSYGWIPHGWDK